MATQPYSSLRFVLLFLLLLGFHAKGQTYYQLSTVSGTETAGGVTVTITPFGTTDGSSFCFGGVAPYYTDADGSGATYTFSSPVASVRLPTQFGINPPFTTATYYINGSFYPLTSANLISEADGECTNGLARVAGGLLDNNVIPTSPSGVVQIDGSITSVTIVLNFSDPSGYSSWGLFFAPSALGFDAGSLITSNICKNSPPKNIGSLLAASDIGTGTLTWSVVSGPSHGTLSGFPATRAIGTSVPPTGTFYQPTSGYTGPDAYTIQVSDGTNTATTTVNVTVGGSSPAIVEMSGGGGYCVDDTGVHVGLVGSAVGIDYQLYHAGLPIGDLFHGIGYLFSFGLQTLAGTYTATATDPISGCTVDMSGTRTVIIYPVPVAYNVTGGGNYCSGGSGVAVGVDNSAIGIDYQLYIGGLPILGALVHGTGSAISFGLQTAAGTYTVVGKNASFTGCTTDMTGSAIISIDPLPTVYTVTGGGSYCAGGEGVSIGLSSTEVGVDYQLYMGTTPVGTPYAGTGGVYTFGFFTTAGTYTVKATNATTGCTSTMSGSATVTIGAIPIIYEETGGGDYCADVPGAVIGIVGSTAGISYQLYFAGAIFDVPIGSPIIGTGGAISYGMQLFSIYGANPIFYVIATNPTTGCSIQFPYIFINNLPPPEIYEVTGGGTYCAGGTGVDIGLTSSTFSTYYQLYRGTTPVGAPIRGAFFPISFGLQTVPGTYTVKATFLGCTAAMAGSATVAVNSSPAVVAMTGGGGYCAGGAGVHVGLAGSAPGVDYQLWMGATAIGGPVAGIGSALDFGLQTAAGVYTVTATNPTTGCSSNMTGSETVTIYSLPTAYNVTGGGAYCIGGSGVAVGLTGSSTGVSYQLYLGGSPVVGSTVAGTGAAISFGTRTAAGTYTVVATSAPTGCTNNMIGSASVTIYSLPTAYTVTGGGAYCTGGTGVPVGLSNSQAGVNYQLYRGTTIVSGGLVAGTGSAISFGLQTATGTYTVVATNASTGCTSNITGSVAISTTPPPTAFTVTGGGAFCAGGTGVSIGLSGSQSGVSYQLFSSAGPSGSPVVGIGAPITFGLRTGAGTYTVVATTAGGCTNNMTGSATVTVNAVPAVFSVTGGGAYCSGGSGSVIGLSGSATGVNYQLYRGTTLVGSPVSGTGSTISFPPQTIAGTYTVIATAAGGCTTAMSGSASVTVSSSPAVVSVSGGGGYCSGGTGVHIGLVASVSGVNYQLWLGGSPVGSPVTGVGGALDFGLITTSGVYTVTATNAAGCSNNMTGSATVVVNATPTVFNLTGGGSYCTGGTGVHVRLSGSTSGVTYKLFVSGTPAFTMTGTGAALDFGLYTTAGTYTVIATNGLGCTSAMSGSVSISVNPNPTMTSTAFTIAPGGTATLTGSIAGGTWTSTLPSVATIGGSTGLATGVSLGTTVITYTLPTGCYAAHALLVTATGHRESHPATTPAATETLGNITVAPNPSKGTFTIKGSLSTANDQEMEIQVTNMFGQVVYTSKSVLSNNEINQTVELSSNLPNGMYLLSVRSGNDFKVVHVVIEK